VPGERVSYAALERELGLLLRRGASLNRDVAADVHPELDAASYSTLARIASTAPARASELSEYFGIDKGAVSRQIRDLERLGLVERAADPLDARARAVRLTDDGSARLHEVQDARRRRFRGLVRRWPPEDIETLARLLGELNQVL
jgi:DNA-binding MarR family transcriptional regulator